MSYVEAANWFHRAADKGNAEAMNWLADCYRNGWGVPNNREQADYWYNRAKQAAPK